MVETPIAFNIASQGWVERLPLQGNPVKDRVLWFNLMRVEIRELRPEVVAESLEYWFTTEVEPRCDEGYLLRHLLK